jgi:hypothetical protein
MRKRLFVIAWMLLCLFFPLLPLKALELKPWFTPMFELQGRATTLGQLYYSVDTKEGKIKYPAGSFFLDLELFTTLLQQWSVEFEAIAAQTRHRSFGFDSLSLTGRYLWMDDVVGDPVSLTTGLTLYKVFKLSRHDLSIFHHGGIEAELHAAIGKEISCGAEWKTRAWCVAGLGVGDLGSPWIRADAHWEHRWCMLHQLRFSLLTLWGLGTRPLRSVRHFQGYGPIQHHSIDAGLRYTYLLNHGIALSAEYAFRVYAHNCPSSANFILFILDWPLTL